MRRKLLFGMSLWALCAFATTAMAEAEVKTDYTDAIKNAAVTSLDSWNVVVATDGDVKYGDGLVKCSSGKTFDFNQTITLPAGQYKVTAQAAYRYASGGVNVAEQAEYAAIQQEGTDTHLAKLYAETSSYKYEADVQNRWDGASETDFYSNLEKVSVVEGKYVPNSSAAVKAWFDNGKYVNELVFNVQEEGEVKIGIAKNSSAPNGDYANIGAWTLSRIGDAEADPEVEEPTPNPEAGDVTAQFLVNADFEQASPQNGDAINTPPGWTMKYEVSGWKDGKTLTDNGSQCYNFWAGGITSMEMYQTVALPAGKYTISANFFYDATEGYRGVYATAGGLTVESPAAVINGWNTVSATFYNENESEVTLGVKSVGWFKVDNVTLEYLGEVSKDDFVNAYNEALEKAQALAGKKMEATVSTELAAVIATYGSLTADNSIEELRNATTAISEKVAVAEASAAAYASNKLAIDAMFALMESTNVYTVEAYEAYSAKAEDFLAQYEAGTLTATVDNPAKRHGWRADVDYDVMLLSAFGAPESDWANLHINTWSEEGETDGSDFKVPFYEYWTGNDQSLGARTFTATMTGLTPGLQYSVEAWIRVRAKDGVAAAEATGVTLSVGDGEAVDVTEGEVVGIFQFSHAVFTATGKADETGALKINFNVLEGNNISWLSFKNVKYTEANEDDPTGIESIDAAVEQVIYDLSGRRVEKMQKGIYIVNGKKVIK